MTTILRNAVEWKARSLKYLFYGTCFAWDLYYIEFIDLPMIGVRSRGRHERNDHACNKISYQALIDFCDYNCILEI